MAKSLRVSDEIWKFVKVEAAQSGERMQAVADALIRAGALTGWVKDPAPPVVDYAPPGIDGAASVEGAPVRVTGLLRCPRCRCLPSQHRKGRQGNRCEVHVGCRWEGMPP